MAAGHHRDWVASPGRVVGNEADLNRWSITMRYAVLTISAFACLSLFFSAISKPLRPWILRREIKRLKADLAKLQKSVSHVEQMKSAISRWTLKNK
jgi:hypothetical protein